MKTIGQETLPKIPFKNLLSLKELLLVAVVFILVLGWLWYVFFTPNNFDGKDYRVVDIKRGNTFAAISDTLYNNDVIPSKFFFRIAAFLYGAENQLQAGRYSFEEGVSYLDLIDKLKKGDAVPVIRVVMYDGISMRGIARKLNALKICKYDEVMLLFRDEAYARELGHHKGSLEGYLLPGTYQFYRYTEPEKVIAEMYHAFTAFFDEKLEQRADEIGYSVDEIVTLASIVDAETNLEEEMPRIAGVYYNRLRIGMALQADPTVHYALGGEYRRLLYEDLNIDSPYNTYKYRGLPPGPISNPGEAALMATLYPERHKFLYFVASPDGGHDFSRTHREHINKAKKYHRWLDARNK